MKSRLKFVPLAVFLVLLSMFAWSWASSGIVHELLDGATDGVDRMEVLRRYFASWGVFSPLVYLLFVVVEVVVAPIPGLMLYAPGGIVFGTFWGGTLTLAGNIIGAGLSAMLVRSMGDGILKRFFAAEKIERVQRELDQRGAVLIFLLRVNPLTSSDVVSYAAGLTRIPIAKIMLATGVGMAPLSYGQAWLAESLLTSFPWLIYPLVSACLAYVAAVAIVIKRLADKDFCQRDSR